MSSRQTSCKHSSYKSFHVNNKSARAPSLGLIWTKAYRVFNHATSLVEETYDAEFDESNGSQGAHENLDDIGDEPLRKAMNNISVGDIKPKDDVQVNDPPSSSSVP